MIRPLRGTLPEDFPKSSRDHPHRPQEHDGKLAWGPTMPLQPFFGILATAPRPEYGRISSVEPREFGGNVDCKEYVAGTSVFLPVFVPGANFSCGDGHAVQGDGEVCLTALGDLPEGHLRAGGAQGMSSRCRARSRRRTTSRSAWTRTWTTPPSRRCAT